MNLLLRIVLLLAMAPLAGEAIRCYAFDYRSGYPLWPLLGLAICFHLYVRLRPAYLKARSFRHESNQSVDSILFLLFALSSAAFVLHLRGEEAFEPVWILRLAVLTSFQFLIPCIAAHRFHRGHTAVTAAVAILLFGLLWHGTEMQRIGAETRLLDARWLKEAGVASVKG